MCRSSSSSRKAPASRAARSGSPARTASKIPSCEICPDSRGEMFTVAATLARTTSGTLSLSADKTGLLASASLDRNDPDVQALIPKMARGDLNEMSFGFRVIEDIWENDMTQRTLRQLDLNGGDVSVVTYPANPNGSTEAIAGVCDASGLVFGLMPHPERHVRAGQHPAWTTLTPANPDSPGPGLAVFRNAVAHIR